MFSKHGTQHILRSEFHNMAVYALLSDTAWRLLSRLTSLADNDGNVDMDPEEIARRSSRPGFDFSDAINELTVGGHLRPYTVNGHPYAAVVGYTDPDHLNYQPIHPKSRSAWRNPTPENPEGVRLNASKKKFESKEEVVHAPVSQDEVGDRRKRGPRPRVSSSQRPRCVDSRDGELARRGVGVDRTDRSHKDADVSRPEVLATTVESASAVKKVRPRIKKTVNPLNPHRSITAQKSKWTKELGEVAAMPTMTLHKMNRNGEFTEADYDLICAYREKHRQEAVQAFNTAVPRPSKALAQKMAQRPSQRARGGIRGGKLGELRAAEKERAAKLRAELEKGNCKHGNEEGLCSLCRFPQSSAAKLWNKFNS